MCNPLDKRVLGHTFHRRILTSVSCQHRQHALLAPTPRVKRNFGLISESTYLASFGQLVPAIYAKKRQGHALQATALCLVSVVLNLSQLGFSGV